MGCHTWFSRPATMKEMKMIKDYAPTEIYNLTGDSKENIENGMYDQTLYDSLMRSFNEKIPCVYGFHYWQLGYGTGNPELENHDFRLVGNKLYFNVPEYTDIFRVKNYSTKIIHNRYELRKWMKKRYFELEDWQLEKVSEFFREYPNGVITFG